MGGARRRRGVFATDLSKPMLKVIAAHVGFVVAEDVIDHGEGFVGADGAFARILFEELENEQASVTRKRGNDLAGMDGRMGVELADIHQIFPEIPFGEGRKGREQFVKNDACGE